MYSSNTHSEDTFSESLGVIVYDVSDEVIWAIGVGKLPEIQRSVLRSLKEGLRDESGQARDDSAQTKLITVGASGKLPLLGLCMLDGDCLCVLLRPLSATSPLFDFLALVPFATEIMEFMISNPHQAVTVADTQGKIRYISPVHEKFLGLPRGGAAGRDAGQVIPNSRLADVVRSGRAEIAQLQQMRGVTRVVNRLPIKRDGKVVGAIGQVLFKDPESAVRMQRDVLSQRAAFLGEQQEGVPLLGDSAPMQRLRREIATVAHLDIPVLILGESGTGKELVARAIHQMSNVDGQAPLVSLNLAALPATLLEAELFGYEPGTFTGANRRGQHGRIEQAQNGTLFLDEVGDIPIEMQAKLLRVLEDRSVQRLGGGESRQVQFRLITATNRNMQQLIDAERFRLDLYYRLSGVVLHIPSLRHRREDIPELLNFFVRDFCRRNNMALPAIESEVVPYLAAQQWPGNVRQLRQRVEEALVFCDLRELRRTDFERYSRGSPVQQLVDGASLPLAGGDIASGEHSVQEAPDMQPDATAQASLREREYRAVRETLDRLGGNKKRAAEALGISRSYLYKILSRADE